MCLPLPPEQCSAEQPRPVPRPLARSAPSGQSKGNPSWPHPSSDHDSVLSTLPSRWVLDGRVTLLVLVQMPSVSRMSTSCAALFVSTGDSRYPLLGQPLQYSHPIRPSLMHGAHLVNHHYHHHQVTHTRMRARSSTLSQIRFCWCLLFLQGPMGIRHGGRGRRPTKKSLSTESSTGEIGNTQTTQTYTRILFVFK